jgi:Rps23 Pro-64 3,4-dihydroxylase Tpa1-like proline 4-hydroxylase
MGKKKAPKQPTTKADLGLFGNTVTGAKGSTFNPTDFQTTFTNNAEQAMLNAQNAYNNREVAQEAVDNMNRQYQTDFQNQLLAPALSKGWLRGSTAQDVATVANQDYQNRRYQLVNDELNRNQQALANNLANYMTIYDISKGVTGLSNALNGQIANFQLEAEKANQADATNRYAANMNAIATALGSAAKASDIRVKENIEKLDTVDGFNIYKFDYINGEKDQVGVIAQEMQELCPECVVEGEILKVDYSRLPEKVQARIKELK